MRAGKRLQVLSASLAVAALLSLPAAASATPQWRSNGVVVGGGPGVGITEQGVVQFGALTLKNAILGEFKCEFFAGGSVRNEDGKGFNAVEGLEQGDGSNAHKRGEPIEATQSLLCSYTGNEPACKQDSFVTSEEEQEVFENSEKVWTPKRSPRNLPWPGELFETTEKTISLNMHKIKIYLVCSSLTEGLEIPFEGNLEPKVINGFKNGLSPSKLVFEGKGGKTSWLGTCNFGVPCETEEHNLYVSGELTLLGTSQQLITAR
jgi:hypothetical protein